MRKIIKDICFRNPNPPKFSETLFAARVRFPSLPPLSVTQRAFWHSEMTMLNLGRKATKRLLASRINFSNSSAKQPIPYSYDRLPRVMTPDMIDAKKRQSLLDKIHSEVEFDDSDNAIVPPKVIDRIMSNDLNVLKGLLNDIRRLNRGVRRRKDDVKLNLEELNAEDVKVVRIARRVIHMYNQHNHRNLELQRVAHVLPDPHPLYSNMLVEARDPLAHGARIKVQASCSIPLNEICNFYAPKPVPFMKVNCKDKKEGKRRRDLKDVSKTDCEALLFANLKNCPIMDKRLGLNKDIIKRNSWTRGKVVRLVNDDAAILAKFAVQEQNNFGNQRVRLRFVWFVGGAWEESISKNVILYHILLVASEGGVEKKFYAAITRNVGKSYRGQPYQCIEWVLASSRKTMPLPC